jgi:hypothetical protein
MPEGLPLLMDRAYEGNETRQLVLDLGMIPVVPPKSNRLHPWDFDRALYKKRNEIEGYLAKFVAVDQTSGSWRWFGIRSGSEAE